MSAYYSGAGNTFFMLDNRRGDALFSVPHIKKLSKKTDGVIFLEKGQKHPLAMRIFNRNGQEADMCGNGIRCLFRFAKKLGLVENRALFETKAGIFELYEEGEYVITCYPYSKQMQRNIMLALDNQTVRGHVVHTGVPHFIMEVKDVKNFPVEEVGKSIRSHPFFGKEGINVNFFEILGRDKVMNRTYERGVEKETGACGTGAMAVASYLLCLNNPFPLTIYLHSGDSFIISIKEDYFLLAGPAQEILTNL